MKLAKRLLCLALCLVTCAALVVPASAAVDLTSGTAEMEFFTEDAPYVQTTMDAYNNSVSVDPLISFSDGGKTWYMSSYKVLGTDDTITVGNAGLGCDALTVVLSIYKRTEGSHYKVCDAMPVMDGASSNSLLSLTEGRGVSLRLKDVLNSFGEVKLTGKEQEGEYLLCVMLMGFDAGENGLVNTVYKVGYYSINDAAAAAIKAYPFDDVDYGSYCWDSVQWALDKGVTKGISKTSFGPKETCTRGQVATFLWRALGSPEPQTTENPFKDIKESDYYYKPILWAYENGITNGTSKTEFSPNGTCTSAHVVTFLWRANGKPAAQAEGTEYYAEAVAWANSKGLLEGVGSTFKPENNSPRADIVTYLYRNAGGK